MKRMSLFIFMFMFMCGVLLPAREPLVIACFRLDPFTMADPVTGEPAGAVIDYWREYIGPALDLEVSFKGPYPISRVSRMLENGEIGAAALFTKIPEREARFLFPSSILCEIESCLMVAPDSPIFEVKAQEDLFDLTVGFIVGGYVPELFKHPRITLELVSNEDYRLANLKKLVAGRIDALLDINKVSLLYYLPRAGFEDRVRIVELPVRNSAIYSLFPDTPRGRELVVAFDRVNREALEKGVFKGILDRYIELE